MAKRLDAFPESPEPAARRYPWSDWADGNAWEIRKGADYDVSTENMRVNVHMKAKSQAIKVRTKKIHDDQGEGLVFQFFDPDAKEAEDLLTTATKDELDRAMELLYADAITIYERAREEVRIPRSDGRTQKYAAVRYKQQLERVQDGKALLIPTIAGIIKKRTTGFSHLEAAGRPDLMVESLVLDETKPYHRFFTQSTVETARKRMEDSGLLP